MPDLLHTLLPASPCDVLSASLVAVADGYFLTLDYVTRGTRFRDVLRGESLLDLIQQLTVKIGFDAFAAGVIVSRASGANVQPPNPEFFRWN